MQERIKRQYVTKAERTAHIEKWRQSGLSMTAYSREANIAFSNLSRWVRTEDKSKFKPVLLSNKTAVIADKTIKILAWHKNGFVLLLKRLEQDRFYNIKKD